MIETSIMTPEFHNVSNIQSKFLTAHILWVVGDLIKAALWEDACLCGTTTNLFEHHVLTKLNWNKIQAKYTVHVLPAT